MTRRDKLKELMIRHDLTIQGVADLLEVSRDTVISWLRPETSKSHREMQSTAPLLLVTLCAGLPVREK